MKPELTVMHIISDLEIGGTQEVVRTLVEYLSTSDGCQPVVCTFQDGPLCQGIERLDIEVEMLPQRRYSIVALPWFIVDMIRIWKSLAGLVKEYDVDVVQTHLLRSLDFLVLPLLYTTNLRVVLWTFHNANFELTADKLPRHKWLLTPKRYSHRFLYRLASRLGSLPVECWWPWTRENSVERLSFPPNTAILVPETRSTTVISHQQHSRGGLPTVE
jgi:hypothetical protein